MAERLIEAVGAGEGSGEGSGVFKGLAGALAVRTLLASASERPDDQRLPVRLVVRASSVS
jgi:hypothetical protein